MKHLPLLFLLGTAPFWGALSATGAGPWPAESNTNAVRLTDVDPGLDTNNWSGAFWNPGTRTLWLACNNPGSFYALVEDGAGGFKIPTNAAGTPAKWFTVASYDMEAICQADLGQDIVYLMDENGYIREYDVSQYGVAVENQNWDIRAQCPEVDSASGPEGLAFIPDEYLRRQGFCDTNGTPCTSSNGMGGLMFVGYQYDGCVYAFDLDRGNGQYGFVGRYKTGRAETADLEFDRATGRLFIWHNLDANYLEITELGSDPDGPDRRLRPLAEVAGPRAGNLEGFALVPSSSTNDAGGCILTDDDNLDREAVMWYRQFQPAADTDADGLSDGWELWHFGSTTQTTGSADSDSDRLSNADEEIAGTDPTNAASALIQFAPLSQAAGREVVLSWRSATGRTYAIDSAAPIESGFTNRVQARIGSTAPVNISTVDISGAASGQFYRVVVEAP